jgi:hypothetical protein
MLLADALRPSSLVRRLMSTLKTNNGQMLYRKIYYIVMLFWTQVDMTDRMDGGQQFLDQRATTMHSFERGRAVSSL